MANDDREAKQMHSEYVVHYSCNSVRPLLLNVSIRGKLLHIIECFFMCYILSVGPLLVPRTLTHKSKSKYCGCTSTCKAITTKHLTAAWMSEGCRDPVASFTNVFCSDLWFWCQTRCKACFKHCLCRFYGQRLLQHTSPVSWVVFCQGFLTVRSAGKASRAEAEPTHVAKSKQRQQECVLAVKHFCSALLLLPHAFALLLRWVHPSRHCVLGLGATVDATGHAVAVDDATSATQFPLLMQTNQLCIVIAEFV